MAKTSSSKNLTRRRAIVLALSLIIILGTLASALWRTGAFLPSWVQWNTYATESDVNGNQAIESMKLTNNHLSIIDAEGNHYITPHDWLISDAQVGDITGDETPEIIMLAWMRNSENPTYRATTFSRTGFSQHVLICDYESGDLTTLWSSDPLRFNAHLTSLDEPGKLSLALSDGGIANWSWSGDGLTLTNPVEET